MNRALFSAALGGLVMCLTGGGAWARDVPAPPPFGEHAVKNIAHHRKALESRWTSYERSKKVLRVKEHFASPDFRVFGALEPDGSAAIRIEEDFASSHEAIRRRDHIMHAMPMKRWEQALRATHKLKSKLEVTPQGWVGKSAPARSYVAGELKVLPALILRPPRGLRSTFLSDPSTTIVSFERLSRASLESQWMRSQIGPAIARIYVGEKRTPGTARVYAVVVLLHSGAFLRPKARSAKELARDLVRRAEVDRKRKAKEGAHAARVATLQARKIMANQSKQAAELGLPTSFSNSLGMNFVFVPAGEFRRPKPYDKSKTVTVHIKYPFYMQTTEVTNAQFRQFKARHVTGWNAAVYGKTWRGVRLNRDSQPAGSITFDEAKSFAAWVSRKVGLKSMYRVPTEDQWELACRCGSPGRYHWGNDRSVLTQYGNSADRTFGSVHGKNGNASWGSYDDALDDGFIGAAPPGTFKPNPLGLHDMHGNVAEWCYRLYNGSMRNNGKDLGGTACGGSWSSHPSQVTATTRPPLRSSKRWFDRGLRLVLWIYDDYR